MMNMDLKRNDIFFTRSKFDDIYKKMNYYKFTDILIFSHIFIYYWMIRAAIRLLFNFNHPIIILSV